MSTNYNYTSAYIFTKHTNLLQWFDTNYHHELESNYHMRSLGFNQLRQSYATSRDVQLILLCRFDGAKIYCKIKCPINPLPVKGEFEVPSISCITKFLQQEGWEIKQKCHTVWFK